MTTLEAFISIPAVIFLVLYINECIKVKPEDIDINNIKLSECIFVAPYNFYKIRGATYITRIDDYNIYLFQNKLHRTYYNDKMSD